MQNSLILHKDMETLTIQSGVQASHYKSVIVEIDEFTKEDLEGLNTWLTNIFQNEYRDVLKIWRLLPENIWESYKRTHFNPEEMLLLRKAQKKLRVVWHKPFRSAEQMKRISAKHHPIKRKPLT